MNPLFLYLEVILAVFTAAHLERVSAAESGAGSSFLTAGAKNVLVGAALEGEGKPALLIRVQEVRKDYETRGFFRIGLLPIEIAQGVVLEIDRPESVSSCLAKAQELLFRKGAHHLELRGVQLIIHGSPATRLACASARSLGGGRLELLGPVSLESATNRLEATHAVLQMTGSGAAELTVSAPPWKINLAGARPVGAERPLIQTKVKP